MRKLLLLTLACVVTPAMANEAPKNVLAGYYSTAQQSHSRKRAALDNPATDITVINATSAVIVSAVPNTPVHDVNAVETNRHVKHSTYWGDTHLNLQDPYGSTFFDEYVCRLAVVTAYGVPGSYRVNVDSEYCNRP